MQHAMNAPTDPVKIWKEKMGKTMLKTIGIQPHYTVLDFGCGSGMYTIAGSQLLNKEGTIIAADKNPDRIRDLSESISPLNQAHITLLHTPDESHLRLETNMIDFILLYDVFHLISDRAVLFTEFKRILKPTGTLSLYPKHHDTELHLTIDDIHQELHSYGFLLNTQHHTTVLHDQHLEEGTVYNYQQE